MYDRAARPALLLPLLPCRAQPSGVQHERCFIKAALAVNRLRAATVPRRAAGATSVRCGSGGVDYLPFRKMDVLLLCAGSLCFSLVPPLASPGSQLPVPQ